MNFETIAITAVAGLLAGWLTGFVMKRVWPGRGHRALCRGGIVGVSYVMGRVLNVQGQPVKGARVELWQANTRGRYVHPSDTNPAPLDPSFDGFHSGHRCRGPLSLQDGQAGGVSGECQLDAALHLLHFEVTGKINRVITQMYFPGEPLNGRDLRLQNIRANKNGLIAKVLPATSDVEPDSRLVVWDIVLALPRLDEACLLVQPAPVTKVQWPPDIGPHTMFMRRTRRE
jgi:Dioxygenase